jgi:hypothetical protein
MAQIIHYFANIVLVEPQNVKFSMQTNTQNQHRGTPQNNRNRQSPRLDM